MYFKITLKKIMLPFFQLCLLLSLGIFATSTSQAQTYVNGVLSTGATALNGTAAPAGFTWSECQNVTGNTTVANSSAGYSANLGAGNSLADDFTIPSGATWNISKLTFYAYSTGAPATPSPFTDLRVRIHSSSPLAGPTTIVFGDLTTNRLTTASSSATYRIFNTLVPPTATGTTRIIWKLEANISATLSAGTYWIEFQTGTALASNFVPASSPVGVRTLPGYNSIQKIGTGAWTALIDGGVTSSGAAGTGVDVPVDIPFIVNYTLAPPCSGTPAPGNTVASIATGCSGTPFSVSLQNAIPGSGVTYQWQSGPSATGPFTNITGATSSSYSSTVTAGAFYQALVTCGANSATSTPVQVALTPASQCYCTTSLASSTADEDIFNVTVGSLNNSSTCTTLAPGFGSILNRYSNFTSGTGAPATPDVVAGANNPFSVGIGTCGGNFTNSVAIFIDLNQDGAFDATERVYVSPVGTVGPHTETGVLVIPASALLGNTRMRVINVETGTPGSITACGGYTWGETEDYNIKLVPCVSLAITGNPTNASAACGSTATFTGAATGTFPTYQWQYRINATAPWQVVNNGGPYNGATTATLSVATDPSLNGYQYRLTILGGCIGAGLEFTTAATLTVTTIQLAINPATITKCLSAAPVLISAPSTQNVVSFTNSTAGFIADGDLAGIQRSVTVSGVTGPIQKVRLTLNAKGAYIGDMVASLKAPNNQIVNLTYLLNRTNNGGGGSPADTGFLNTIFNVNRVLRGTPFSGGGVLSPASQGMDLATPPYTGEYPIDNQQALFFVGVPSGPTGLAATTANINTFYAHTPATAANGVWTLGMYDAGPPDPITFKNYTLEITYGGAPATMVFTPITGLFTDAAGTIPYTGGPVTQVYAAPGANTTYSAVISAGLCSTAAQSIVVNVNTPVAGTPTLTNATICAGKNTSFVLGGTLTGGPGFTHNYQVSTDNGVTFTNITNGGVYSGANTNTLVLTGVPASYNGYRYRDSVNTSGGCGFKLSTVATLTVNPTPVVTISAAPITKLFPGLTTTLTAAVSPNPTGATYQWLRNGAPVAGATSNTYVVTIDALGAYTVNVTDVNTCSNTATTPASIAISDSANADRLFIYPSPNLGQFQVRYFNDVTNTATAPAFVNIFDAKGTRVFSKSYSPGAGYGAMNIDLGIHGKGVYRVDLLNSRGERIKTGSVMVF